MESLRRVLRSAPDAALGYGDPRDAATLRGALAAYLGRVRGALAEPERMLICAGFAQGLGPRLPHPARSGVRRLAMEDPGHVDQQTIVRRAGLDVVPVPVDERGLIVGELEAADPDAVVVTPVHQFPTGSVLAADRRTALLAWAERRGAVVIEDDYDAEYRCSEPSIAPKRVTTGSSRSLAALYPPGRIDRPPPGGRKVPSCGRFGGRGRTPTVAS